MAVSFRQTGVDTDCAHVGGTTDPYCSTAGGHDLGDWGDSFAASKAVVGGTSGGTQNFANAGGSMTGKIFAFFELSPGSGYSWDAGNYVIRVNVTTAANMGVDWNETFICRVDSSCVSQATIGSLTGQAIALSSTGVKEMTVSGAAQATAAATDKILVLCYTVIGGGGSGTGVATLDQDIDTPLTAVATDNRPKQRRRAPARVAVHTASNW